RGGGAEQSGQPSGTPDRPPSSAKPSRSAREALRPSALLGCLHIFRRERRSGFERSRMMPDPDELLYLNGLNAITGEPLIKPVALDEIAGRIMADFRTRRIDLQFTYDRSAFDEIALDDPARAGWALIVHADEADAMKERLARLIDHRSGRVFVYRGEAVRVWK